MNLAILSEARRKGLRFSGFSTVTSELDTLFSMDPPPAVLLRQAGGASATRDPGRYLRTGYGVARWIALLSAGLGKPVASAKRVLDLGCGCGRVLRYLGWVRQEGVELWGSDVMENTVQWCREAYPFAQFVCHGPEERLPFREGSVDLVYAISVLSHLDAKKEDFWLGELERILTIGGLAFVSVHGEEWAMQVLEQGEYEALSRDGIFHKVVSQEGVDGLPPFYQVTYHTRRYVEEHWGRRFDLVGYLRHGAVEGQDLVILQKKGGRGAGEPYFYLENPMGSLDVCRMEGAKLVLRGWALEPTGGALLLDLWLDGRRQGRYPVLGPSPAVRSAFPRCLHAGYAGFEIALPVDPPPDWKEVILSSRSTRPPLFLAPFCGRAPFGSVDVPSPGQTVEGPFEASGWALAQAGIRRVCLWVDGGFFLEAELGWERLDVAQCFPGYPQAGRCGWRVFVDTEALSPESEHFVVAVLESQDGLKEYLGAVPFRVKPRQ
jgi:SAM-dependent methyltransferase